MLGLGLSFMRSMFGKTTGQLDDLNEGITDQLIEDIRKSGAKLTFDKEDIKIDRGESDELYFGVKNVLPDSSDFGITAICDRALTSIDGNVTEKIELTVFDTTRQLEQGEVDVQKMLVEPSSTAELTTYSCQLTIGPELNPVYAKKAFYITVE